MPQLGHMASPSALRRKAPALSVGVCLGQTLTTGPPPRGVHGRPRLGT